MLPSEKKNWELINFCEFDKFAIKSYCAIHNVDESLNLGDITEVDETKLEQFNMICGGSPCQDFSVAGKQKGSIWTCKDCEHKYNPLTVHWSERDTCPNCHSENIEKTRSSLLVEYLRVIRANKPNLGMYENVKNIVGKQFKDTFKMFTDELDEYGYNVYWKVLNAKNYGIPQNRERVYLIFIKKELDNGKFVFPEGFDNGVRLRDILEEEVEEKYYISQDKMDRFITNLNSEDALLYDVCQIKREGKAREYNDYCPTLSARDYKDPRLVNDNVVKQVGNISECNGNWKNPQVGRIYSAEGCSPTLNTCGGGGHEPKILQVGNVNPSGKGMNGNVFSADGLAPTLTTNKGEGNKIAIHQSSLSEIDPFVVASRGRNPENPSDRTPGAPTVQRLEPKFDGRTNTLTTVQKDNYVVIPQATKKGYIECEIGGVADLSYPNSKTRRGRVQDNGQTCPTITATETGICRIESPIRIRKLTPKECFRLMGFSDENYQAAKDAGVSNSQLYKQTGNSIVVDVLYYILVELYKAMPYLFDDLRLSSFFSGIGAFEIALNRLYESINTGNFTNPQTD